MPASGGQGRALNVRHSGVGGFDGRAQAGPSLTVGGAERPATPAAAPALAPTSRFFPDSGPHGRVAPFGRKDGTVSEARQTRDLPRRGERICAATRARVDEIR